MSTEGVILSRPDEWRWGYCDPCEAWTGGPFHSERVRSTEVEYHPWGSFFTHKDYTDAICFWCGTRLKGLAKVPPGGMQGITLAELLADAPAR